MPTLKIEVTAEDIANGQPGDCESCPIALAIQRLYPDAEEISVDGHAYWGVGDKDYFTRLPPAAKEFISLFDAERSVYPFDFECDVEIENCSDKDEDGEEDGNEDD